MSKSRISLSCSGLQLRVPKTVPNSNLSRVSWTLINQQQRSEGRKQMWRSFRPLIINLKSYYLKAAGYTSNNLQKKKSDIRT